jgi:hypothetical protein
LLGLQLLGEEGLCALLNGTGLDWVGVAMAGTVVEVKVMALCQDDVCTTHCSGVLQGLNLRILPGWMAGPMKTRPDGWKFQGSALCRPVVRPKSSEGPGCADVWRQLLRIAGPYWVWVGLRVMGGRWRRDRG